MKIKDYEIAALRIALLYTRNKYNLPANIENTNPYEAETEGKPLKFGITYFAGRKTTAEEALKNAEIMKQCAEYATKFNELEMTVDTDCGAEEPHYNFDDLVLDYADCIKEWRVPAFEGGAQ